MWVFVQKIQEVAKAVCSSEWQRRGPATQFSRKSAEEILTGIVSVFPGFFFFNLMLQRLPCSDEPFTCLNTIINSLGI